MSSRSSAFPAFIVCFLVTQLCTARVDTVAVRSPAMNKEVKAAVVLPAAYDGRKALPVMYLLHGFSDTYQSWLTRPPEKGLV